MLLIFDSISFVFKLCLYYQKVRRHDQLYHVFYAALWIAYWPFGMVYFVAVTQMLHMSYDLPYMVVMLSL
mgnify:CR=1 FL=1